MDNSRPPQSYLTLQQNLASKIEALEQLDDYQKINNIPISLIQDPPIRSGSIPHDSDYSKVFCHHDNPRAAILVAKTTPAILHTQSTSSDICVCEVNLNNTKIFMISVYFSPNESIITQTTQLTTVIQNLPNDKFIIGGDFNGWHPEWGSSIPSPRGIKINQFINGARLHRLNRPTAAGFEDTYQSFATGIGSKLDLTMTSYSLISPLWSWKVLVDVPTDSDHRIIEFGLRTHTPHQPTQLSTRIFKTTNIDWSQFHLAILAHKDNWLNSFTEATTSFQVDAAATRFMKELIKICESTLPKKTIGKISRPWWNSDLEKLKKKCVKWGRKTRKATNRDLKDVYFRILRTHQETYGSAIMTAKYNHFKQFLETQDRETVLTKAYRLVRSTKNSVPQTVQRADNSFTTDAASTAQYLLDMFLPNDDDTEDTQEHTNMREAALEQTGSVDDMPFTTYEIEAALRKQKDKKSPGEDGITANVVKQLFETAPEVLTEFYKACLVRSSFPAWFKSSYVKAIPKNNDHAPSSAKAWRPISLLSVPGKILEKLMIDRIYFHMNLTGSLSPDQYGFTSHKSTLDAISIAAKFIKSVRDGNRFGAVISLDISGAFDNAWWPAILTCLQKHAVPQNLIDLCKDYFTQRKASLTIASARAEKDVTKGCPQGSTCGPGLWNILYDDILKLALPADCRIVAFADDSLLMVDARDPMSLQNKINDSLQRIVDWGKSVKLEFNESKTQALLIHTKQQQNRPDVRITMSGKAIEFIHHFKYLGVVLDDKLSWKQHFDYLQNKTMKIYYRLARMAKNTWGIPWEACTEIYEGAIEPMLLYGCQTWLPALDKQWQLGRLQGIQRLFLLRIIKSYRTVSFDAACIMANIMPIDLKAKYVAAVSEVKAKGLLQISPRNRPIKIQKAAPRLKHPAKKRIPNCKFSFTRHNRNSSARHACEIYTDGSKMETGVGAAFVVYHHGTEVHSGLYKLPDYCSVFQAELLAVKQALQYVKSAANMHETVHLYSDSSSGLMAIRDSDSTAEIVQSIHDILSSLRRSTVALNWIKAHVGHEGNERADQLAKHATQHGMMCNVKAPLSFAKRSILLEYRKKWNARWRTSKKGRWTRIFFPTIEHRRTAKHFSPNFITTQFVSGHGKFNKYLSKYRIRGPRCKCGRIQNCSHLIFDCKHLTVDGRPMSETYFSRNYFHCDLANVFKDHASTECLTKLFESTHKILIEWEAELYN